MKKKIKYIFFALLILYGIFIIYKEIKMPSMGQYYIVEINNTDTVLSKEDKEELIKTLNLNEEDEIDKIAYMNPYVHDGNFYVFLHDGEVYEHICLGTSICEEYKTVKKIVDKYYKWWKNNGKYIDIEELEEEKRREL